MGGRVRFRPMPRQAAFNIPYTPPLNALNCLHPSFSTSSPTDSKELPSLPLPGEMCRPNSSNYYNAPSKRQDQVLAIDFISSAISTRVRARRRAQEGGEMGAGGRGLMECIFILNHSNHFDYSHNSHLIVTELNVLTK